jgi:outer membrane protein assembly factor BamB
MRELWTSGICAWCGRLVAAATLALAWYPLQAQDNGEDWPRFLGPLGNNTSRETGLLERWPPGGPPLVWERTVGAGYSAPSVSRGRVIVHHRIGDEEIVEALDAKSGEPLWRHAYASHFRDPFGYNNGPRCTPLLTTDRCYTFGAEGRLVCLDIRTGEPVWQRETTREWNVPEGFFGVGSTPLLEGDKLIVMIGGQPNAGVVALDAGSGRTLWENVGKTNWNGATTLGWRGEAPYRWTGEEKLASYSTPVAATIHGQRLVLCLLRQGLVAINPTSGAIHFSRWFQAPVNESVNAMCPVVWDDLVLISSAYQRTGGVVLRVKPDGRSFEDVWRSPAGLQDRQPVLEIHWNTPVLHEGFLYAFSGRNEPDATFRCVEMRTGRLCWSRDETWAARSSSQPSVYGRGSAIMADGRLIVLGEGGRLGLFRPNPKQPEEVSAFQIPQFHYPCWTAPVLSHKRLYLRSEDRLLCFNLDG